MTEDDEEDYDKVIMHCTSLVYLKFHCVMFAIFTVSDFLHSFVCVVVKRCK